MAKWDSNTKRQRNAEIAFLHKLKPELSLDEIGEKYKITGARVWAILKRAEEQAIANVS